LQQDNHRRHNHRNVESQQSLPGSFWELHANEKDGNDNNIQIREVGPQQKATGTFWLERRKSVTLKLLWEEHNPKVKRYTSLRGLVYQRLQRFLPFLEVKSLGPQFASVCLDVFLYLITLALSPHSSMG
jgi:predicted DNA binding CopG/RHH family protein